MRVVTKSGDLVGSPGILVPTMGALHAGHLSLVDIALRHRQPGEQVIVSIFVNPTQFNAAADLEAYPRTLESDLAHLREVGADVAFCPAVHEVYPPGFEIPVPELPAVATEPGLEDAGRPGHFAGVCQVVSRLFDLCQPRAAIFGEKDWQQLQVVRAMVLEQQRDVDIISGPIAREPGGLAMSSRNVRLRPADRARALAISRCLTACGRERDPSEAERVMREVLAQAVDAIHYAVVRDAETLMPLKAGATRGRALVCAEVGGVRLLDNAPWECRH